MIIIADMSLAAATPNTKEVIIKGGCPFEE
jgi:hypothetical protein